jgi:hypothetical protein
MRYFAGSPVKYRAKTPGIRTNRVFFASAVGITVVLVLEKFTLWQSAR